MGLDLPEAARIAVLADGREIVPSKATSDPARLSRVRAADRHLQGHLRSLDVDALGQKNDSMIVAGPAYNPRSP
jgi:hypothetical protein